VEVPKIDVHVEAPSPYEREHLAERPQMEGLKLRGQPIVGREDCCWNKIRLRML
jgi:hypothetical protein